MGKGARTKPDRLAEKLLQVRLGLGLSQSEMVRHLELEDVIAYTKLSHYELGRREPTLPILLRYARAAGVCVDVLIDDELELPDNIPSTPMHKGIKKAAKNKTAETRRTAKDRS